MVQAVRITYTPSLLTKNLHQNDEKPLTKGVPFNIMKIRTLTNTTCKSKPLKYDFMFFTFFYINILYLYCKINPIYANLKNILCSI